MDVKILKINDAWYGMNYREDVTAVKDSFQKMLEKDVGKCFMLTNNMMNCRIILMKNICKQCKIKNRT